MRRTNLNLTSLYLIFRGFILFTVEQIWIPLCLKVNRHWLGSFYKGAYSQSPSRIIFFPAGTPACRFQHKSLAAHLRRSGHKTTVVTDPKFFISPVDDSNSQDFVYHSFSDLTHGIIELCQGDLVFATGVIDSFLASCSSDTFFGNFIVPKEFVKLIDATRVRANESVLDYNAIVLTDGAYMLNRALISSALGLGKKVYIFNPDGDWLEFTEQYGENHKDFESYLNLLSPEEYKSALAEANTFLDARFKGKQTDLDSPGVFSEIESIPISATPKKVLFMHVFRDANQVQLDQTLAHQSLFSSYFEWANFCLREVSNKPEEWQVKLHPSSKFYGDEIDIQLQLLERHGIPMDIVNSCPTTSQILTNHWPIFTHSGTIALESAVFGYRSHVCSSRHPENLVYLAKSESELIEQLRKPPSRIEDPLESADEEMARLLLHWNFKHDVPLLAPKNPQPDRSSHLKFQLSTMTQELSLMGRYIRPSTQVQLQKMALELTHKVQTSVMD